MTEARAKNKVWMKHLELTSVSSCPSSKPCISENDTKIKAKSFQKPIREIHTDSTLSSCDKLSRGRSLVVRLLNSIFVGRRYYMEWPSNSKHLPRSGVLLDTNRSKSRLSAFQARSFTGRPTSRQPAPSFGDLLLGTYIQYHSENTLFCCDLTHRTQISVTCPSHQYDAAWNVDTASPWPCCRYRSSSHRCDLCTGLSTMSRTAPEPRKALRICYDLTLDWFDYSGHMVSNSYVNFCLTR